VAAGYDGVFLAAARLENSLLVFMAWSLVDCATGPVQSYLG
jgi:hypothetical protein